MTLAYIARLLCLWVAVFTSLSVSCGVLVHNEVFRRAQYLFSLPSSESTPESLLRSHLSRIISTPSRASSVQAGAFFPDWGYGCLSNDDFAEMAHWPPFIVATVEHITRKYGAIRVDDTPKVREGEEEHINELISFVFAMAAHGSADATWHSLRLYDGLLRYVSNVDYNGDTAKAHNDLDVGGDVIMSTRLLSKDWLSDSWTVPLDDLLEIYHSLGKPVSKTTLRYCNIRGLAALQTVVQVGERLYKEYAGRSAAIVDEIDGYYLGGMDEMSANAAWCWGNLTKWLGDGEDLSGKDGWGMCDVFKIIKDRMAADGHAAPETKLGRAYLEQWMTEKTFVDAFKANVGNMTTSIDKFGSETYTLRLSPAVLEGVPYSVKEGTLDQLFKEPTFLSTNIPHSYFGQYLTPGFFNLNAPDTLYLAASAPIESEDSNSLHNGNVYIIDMSDITSQDVAPFKHNLTTSSTTSHPNDRFGYASTSLNLLNEKFLVITAPGGQAYAGPQPHAPITAGRLEIFQPPNRLATISMLGNGIGSVGHREFGITVLAADIDNDGQDELLVATRNDRMRSGCGIQFGEGEVLVFRPSHWLMEVGVECQLSAQDVAVSIITLPESEKQGRPCEHGTFDRFGATLAFTPVSQLIAIGAPGLNKVFLYQHDRDSARNTHVFSLTGPERSGFGGFAMITGVTSKLRREWLAVSSPNEDQQSGVVRLYRIIDGREAILIATLTSEEKTAFGKFGMTMVKEDDEEGTVWIGSPWAEGERGVVWWVAVGAIVDSNGTDWTPPGDERHQMPLARGEAVKTYRIGAKLVGPEAKGHFGASLAVGDINGDGKKDLMVGIPLAGAGDPGGDARFRGAVAVYVRV